MHKEAAALMNREKNAAYAAQRWEKLGYENRWYCEQPILQ